ncbi:MAG: recombination mediator RecR [Pseudomonadaceae bacterium]|nr:recombination mediator RecR [Pseudomonadaceae bacterium]
MADLINELIERLQVLPGVGPKSAQRMAFNLLQRNRHGGELLAQALSAAMAGVRQCTRCRNYTQTELCRLCEHPRRDDELLCVVESPADIIAFEAAGGFRGRYFVLHGRLSPIDGIGPDDLGLDLLAARAGDEKWREVILATNPTVEGEATAHYIATMLKNDVALTSRIAHGVPLGGELEYIDGGTLAHALEGRRHLS